jgi:hypothetical protein
LTDDRSASGLATVTNNSFCTPSSDQIEFGCTPISPRKSIRSRAFCSTHPHFPASRASGSSRMTRVSPRPPSAAHIDNAFIPGTGRFIGDTAVADLDYNATSKDTVSLKYFYQHDPTLAPYSYSSVPGFTEHLDSGAQVASIINTLVLKPNLSTTQTLGIAREKDWADNEQPFGPGSIPGGAAGTGSINMFGSKYFPGVSVYNVLGDYQPSGSLRQS